MPSTTPYTPNYSNSAPRPSPNHQSNGIRRRPATIAELAERAFVNLWDPSKDLKSYLRAAERHRNTGRVYAEEGDLESAFVEYARAATLVLENLPTHRDYHTLLTSAQRHNLGLNGQDILDSLGRLKPTLVDRHERWLREHPNEVAEPHLPRTPLPHTPSTNPQTPSVSQPRTPAPQTPARPPDPSPRRNGSGIYSRSQEEGTYRDHKEDQRRWDKDDVPRRAAEDANRQRRDDVTRRSADVEYGRRFQESEYNRGRFIEEADRVTPLPAYRPPDDETRRQMARRDEEAERQRAEAKRLEEETKRREEDLKHRTEERRRQEQEGIMRRQQEADTAARAVRQNPSPNVPISISRVPVASPVPVSLRPSNHVPDMDAYLDEERPLVPMPLESPTRFEDDTTDSESQQHSTNGKGSVRSHHHSTPTRGSARYPAYPAPITTTSPPPVDVRHIEYPSLMSQHQMTQGYVPSLQSMFKPSAKVSPNHATLLFVSDSSNSNSSSLYNILPSPSVPITSPAPPYHYHDPYQQQRNTYQSQGNGYPAPTRTVIPPPPPPPQNVSPESRIIRSVDPQSENSKELKTVYLPRDCLPRFLSIAKLNTARNRETCGLLLGKPKGDKYSVTTLLIPKQHSTSDTCTMDEEELVLQFTEERALITLGWIHTHPSQSCFMSSVDLHTHSGFQRMLPESFAVVCAPKHTPNFGIFRLTDPPGLQTILECNVKDAFHPHTDLPIYTDADKGHVQMKDTQLEIVDLR